jgi:2-oxoglutarate dehydrogenase E2 component (dihydrolipoamide succinyltransferase)
MAHDVVMPQMGESVAEGTVTAWLKEVGERVERDEPLFEISTDKVDAEIPSPVSGVLLEIKVQPGETVAVNSVVAVIGAESESAAEAVPPEKESEPGVEAAPSVQTAPSSEPEAPAATPPASTASLEERRRTKSSPLVRKIAAEHQIDLTSVRGTGAGGRVTKQDIMGVVEHGGAVAAAAPVTASAPVAGRVPDAIPEAYWPRVLEGDRVEEMSTMRAKIAEHMVLSKRISPHVATVWEIDFSHVAEVRERHKQRWLDQYGVPLTYTAFIMKATVDALKSFPMVNASVDGERAIYHRDIHLGLAVALEWGLIVPVIQDAGELNLLGLARRGTDLAERARTKRLKPEEVQSGTFTITNPGSFGPLFNVPVINQPQVGILGVGGVEKRPVVIDDMIAIRTRAYLSLSFDHRLVDGAVADQFMGQIKKGIQEFDESEL